MKSRKVSPRSTEKATRKTGMPVSRPRVSRRKKPQTLSTVAPPHIAYEDFVALLLTRLKQAEALFDLIDPEDQRHTVDANGERHFFCHVAPPSCFASVVELDFDWEGACPDTVLVQVDLKCHIIDRHAPDLELANLYRWAAKMITARQHSFPVPRKTWIPNEMRFQVEECRPAYSWKLSSPKMSIEYLSQRQEPPRLQVGEVSPAILAAACVISIRLTCRRRSLAL